MGGHRSDSCGHGSEPGLWREKEAKEARLCWGQGGEKKDSASVLPEMFSALLQEALGEKHFGLESES